MPARLMGVKKIQMQLIEVLLLKRNSKEYMGSHDKAC
jgi:hypothetical protein